jgi:hypothetical protein
MRVHGSRALTAEGTALAVIDSAVGTDDGGANYFKKRKRGRPRLLFPLSVNLDLDPRGLRGWTGRPRLLFRYIWTHGAGGADRAELLEHESTALGGGEMRRGLFKTGACANGAGSRGRGPAVVTRTRHVASGIQIGQIWRDRTFKRR